MPSTISSPRARADAPPTIVPSDKLHLLVSLQKNSFNYFTHEVNPTNGLIKDKTAEAWPSSIAAVGMALTVYPIAVERGFMQREAAAQRTLTTLRFFAESEQSDHPDATGYRGFYYHFLDMESGKRAWNCELSSIDTGLFIAGALTAGQYFDQDNETENAIGELADLLYRRVDWPWMLAGSSLLCHGWRPEKGFLQWHWQGYDEALILYLLALGSPSFAIPSSCYGEWTKSYEWKTIYGMGYLHAGPLFIHQMSHLWIDFRGLQDHYMRHHESDYFKNSRVASLVQQQYAITNPMDFALYSELCWGITASDGPGNMVKKIAGVERVFYDYFARGAPYGPDDGTLAPWAVAACLPFAPEIVWPSIEHYHRMRLHEVNPYGFKASFSSTFQTGQEQKVGWVSPYHFGINEGPTVIMIDNYLHDFPWRIMRQNAYLKTGLQRAGFRGGWLNPAAVSPADNIDEKLT